MPETIDVHDLAQEDIQFIQRLVELLRGQTKKGRVEIEEKDVDKSGLTAHPSDVIGNLTREEIYDHL